MPDELDIGVGNYQLRKMGSQRISAAISFSNKLRIATLSGIQCRTSPKLYVGIVAATAMDVRKDRWCRLVVCTGFVRSWAGHDGCLMRKQDL
jgi:hypothetical protein